MCPASNWIHDQQGINTPFRAPSDGPGPGVREHLTRPLMLMVLALLLGAVVLLFLPDFKSLQTQIQARDDAAALPLAQRAEVASKPNAVASASPSAEATLSEVKPGADTAPAQSNPALTPSPQMAAAPSTQVTASGILVAGVAEGGLLNFRATGTSWVEVTDAKGVVVLRRMLGAGESAGAQGAMPLAVVVGRADATQVRVRGKAFDLAPVAKDNVARFEVK